MKKVLTVLLGVFIFLTAFAGNVRISTQGREFIKQQEACVLHAYWDSNGYSIGYGHHHPSVKKGMRITQAQADAFFNQDIAIVEASVQRLLDELPYDYEFSQGFIDGFGSFVYNCGEFGAKRSLFYRTLRNCRVKNGVMNLDDYEYALTTIKSSAVRCKGHKTRRQKEYNMMKGI